MDKFISSSDLAKVLVLTVQRVNQLAKDGTIKREADGKFDISSAVEAYYRFKLLTDAEVDYQKEHAKHEAAKRELAEIELLTVKNTLLYASEVKQMMVSMIVNVRSRLLSLPSRCAPQIIGQRDMSKIVEVLRVEVFQALNELSETPLEKMMGDTFVEDPLRAKMG